MSQVGVIGAGVMGTGLAQTLAQWGHTVALVDVSQATLDQSRAEIRRQLRFSRMLGVNGLGDDVDVVLGRISGTTSLHDLEPVDFVVENVTESFEAKSLVYPVLDQVCREEVVFAVNTSCVSITRIASLTNRADRVLGIHFMNPVPMKKTVEMIRGLHTSESSIATALGILESIGKEAVIVEDMPGFVSNRVLMLTVNEAAFVLQDQVASASQIDRIFRECFGHPMGPLETADLIGLDTILNSLDVLYESYNDSKYRPCPLLRKLVYGGKLGRKSGEGFHPYSENQERVLNASIK